METHSLPNTSTGSGEMQGNSHEARFHRAIYLDGSDAFSRDGTSGGSGYCGATIFGNVLSASTGGALYTAGGNDNFTNNVVIARDVVPGSGALRIGAVNNASTERRPGSHFNTNIFLMQLPHGANASACGADSSSPRPFRCPMVIGGDFYDDLGEAGAGTATRWAGSDRNVFWSPDGVETCASRSCHFVLKRDHLPRHTRDTQWHEKA
jgi:hypothetical protein